MLTQYSNTNNISNTGPDTLVRFNTTDYNVLNAKIVPVTGLSSAEIHFYLNDTWITGNHNIPLTNTTNPDTGVLLYDFDIKQVLNDLKLTTGKFRFVLNFFHDVLGSYNNQFLYI